MTKVKETAQVITPEMAKIPAGPLEKKWTNYKDHQKLVNPANKRRLDVIVVGTGLAGASAAASLAEMGFNVLNFCIQDSPRRAHSIAAQGGINAAKNYQNDGDSVYRLFYDTIKGGDYRAREANVYRLALSLKTDMSIAAVSSINILASEYFSAEFNNLFHSLSFKRFCLIAFPLMDDIQLKVLLTSSSAVISRLKKATGILSLNAACCMRLSPKAVLPIAGRAAIIVKQPGRNPVIFASRSINPEGTTHDGSLLTSS